MSKLKIKSVTKIGIKEVFDIEIPQYHNFILDNGAIAHNCSHSISYGAISYETAWLKANFPCEFYAALLSFEENQDLINDIIIEAKKQGIKFVPPDVNKSTDSFAPIDSKTIAYSLTCMKGIGPSVAKRIAGKRPYVDMVDFIARSRINLGATKILIKSGAFDNAFEKEKISRKNYFDFAHDCVDRIRRQTDRLMREDMIERYGYIEVEGLARKKAKEAGTYESPSEFHDRMYDTNDKYKEEYDLEFGKKCRAFSSSYEWTAPMKIVQGKIAELVKRESGEDERQSWTQEEHYLFEEEIFGVSLSGHRLDVYKNREDAFFETVKKRNVKYIRMSDSLDSFDKGDIVYVYGMLTKMSRKSPYKKDPSQFMRAFNVEDRFGKATVSIFEQDFRNTKKDEKLICIHNDKKIHKGPFWLVEKKSSDPRLSTYNPILILKCVIGEFAGRKSLNYSAVGDWINRSSISDDLIKQRDLELQEIQNLQKEIDESKGEENE